MRNFWQAHFQPVWFMEESSGNEIYCNQRVRSGVCGRSHFHAPPAIKSWAARGLIMRARIYVNARAKKYILYLGLLYGWQRIISQSDVLTFISIFQNAPTDIHRPRTGLAWTKFGTATSRKNVLSWRYSHFSAGKKSMMRPKRDSNRGCFLYKV